MARPTVKDADFVGKAAYLAQRADAARRDPVHADASTTRRSSTGRQALHARPRADPRRPTAQPLVDAKGRRSYVTSAGSGPSVGKHLLMSYLPPEHAVDGDEARRRVLRRALPGDGRRRRRDAAVRPRERPDPVLTPADVNILVCVKRVPGDRRPDRPDRRRARHRHALPRLHGQPPRGVRGRGGRPDRRGARRLVGGPDARAGRGRGPAPRRDGDRHRAGDPARDRRRATGTRSRRPRRIVEAIRAQEAADGPFDLILFGNESADTGGFQVGIRVAAALGRPVVPGSRRSRSATARSSRGARHRRRLGGLRAAAAGGRRGQGGDQPAALPVGPGPAAGEEEGDRAARRRRGSRPASRRSGWSSLPSRRGPRPRSSARGPDAAPARRRPARPDRGPGLMTRRSSPRRARRRRAGPAGLETLTLARRLGAATGGRSEAVTRSRRRRPTAPRAARSPGRRADGASSSRTTRLDAVSRPTAWAAAIAQLSSTRAPDGRRRRRDRARQRAARPRRRPDRPADGRERASTVEPGERWRLTRQRWAGQPPRGLLARRAPSSC